MPTPTTDTEDPHKAEARARATAFARIALDADAFSLDGSPLLSSWYNFDDSIHSDEGLTLEDLTLPALTARWEDDGKVIEEDVTVADLLAARIENGALIYPSNDGDVCLEVFKLTPVDIAIELAAHQPSDEANPKTDAPRMRS